MTAWLDSNSVERLHRELADIPSLYARLPAIRTGIKGQSGGVHTPPGSKPPLAVHVVDLLDLRLKDAAEWDATDPRDTDVLDRYGVVPRIGLWVRMIDEEMDAEGEHVLALDAGDWQDITALCAAVKLTTPWLIGQQWVTELADDISRLWTGLRATLGERKEYKPTCRWCAHKCDPQDGGTWYRCMNCGADYTWQGQIGALLSVQEATGEECAEQLGISWATVRQWASRGLLTDCGKDRRGRKLYALDAVASVQRDIAARRIVLAEKGA